MEKKLNILIANDDGIRAPGIERLARAALPFGTVWVAAPESQCSGMSQKITIHDGLRAEPYAFPAAVAGAWSVFGTPADCVSLARRALLPCRPDVVFSGINNGYNAGFDVAYSGTVGAALEAVMGGIPAIAFSMEENGDTGALDHYLPLLIGRLLADLPEPGAFWNVNFPGLPLKDCAGVLYDRVPAKMSFYESVFTPDPDDPARFVMANDTSALQKSPDGTDIHAVAHGFVSVGKIRSALF